MATKKVQKLKETAEEIRIRVEQELQDAEQAVVTQIEEEQKMLRETKQAIEAVVSSRGEGLFLGIIITPEIFHRVLELMISTGENVKIPAEIYIDEE